MVPVLSSPTLLQNTCARYYQGILLMYSCSEKKDTKKRIHQLLDYYRFVNNGALFLKPDIIAEYMCPILLGNTTYVQLQCKTDTKWCLFCQARHYCRIHVAGYYQGILLMYTCSEKQNIHHSVPVLSSPTLLQNTCARYYQVILLMYSCSEKENGHQMVSVLSSPTLLQNTCARYYQGILLMYSCSEKENGHQMVPVLSSPTLLQNTCARYYQGILLMYSCSEK